MAGVLLMAFTVVALSRVRVEGFSGDTVADRGLGQPDMFHNGANTVAVDVFNQPNQIPLDRSVTPNRLYVADAQKSRILGYHSVAALVTGSLAAVFAGLATGGVAILVIAGAYYHTYYTNLPRAWGASR